MLKHGSQDIIKVIHGNQEVKRIQHGADVVYEVNSVINQVVNIFSSRSDSYDLTSGSTTFNFDEVFTPPTGYKISNVVWESGNWTINTQVFNIINGEFPESQSRNSVLSSFGTTSHPLTSAKTDGFLSSYTESILYAFNYNANWNEDSISFNYSARAEVINNNLTPDSSSINLRNNLLVTLLVTMEPIS